MKHALPLGGLAAIALQKFALAGGPASPAHAQPTCPPPTATTGNLLSNADFETVINGTVIQSRDLPNPINTKVCSWWDANNSASYGLNACATGNSQIGIDRNGAPNNFLGSQAPRSGNGYIAFLARAASSGSPNSVRSYATTQLAILLSAQPATMVIRSLISGAIVQELALPNHETEATLNTQDLPNGVYAVSLLVSGRALSNRRLLVNH